MNDKHPEVVTVELGGETRRLKLGASAMRRAEMRGAVPSYDDMATLTLPVLCRLLWVSLLPDNNDLEEETVLGWLDEAGPEAEAEAIGKVRGMVARMVDAYSRAFADVRDTKKKKQTQ